MPKPNRKRKFAPSRLIDPNIAPIVHLPSGQRFNPELYHKFFEKGFAIVRELPLSFNEIVIETKNHIEDILSKSSEKRFDIDSIFSVQPFSEGQLFRFALCLLWWPPKQYQVKDCFDFAVCDPENPERTYSKLSTLHRSIVNHFSVEFGSRFFYFVQMNNEGSNLKTQIEYLQSQFTTRIGE